MIRILLIRHGETILLGQTLYGRMPGVELSAKGLRQAETLARSLKRRFHLAEVISSPMERTRETARFIANAFNLPLLIDEGFNEIDCGVWMGKQFNHLQRLESWTAYNRHRSLAHPPGGESMMDVQSRAWAGIERIANRHQGKNEVTVAVVTHGDVIRSLLLLFLGIPGDLIHRIEVGPGSVTEVALYGLQPRVISMNRDSD